MEQARTPALTGEGAQGVKPVFPVLYFCVFVWTLMEMYWHFIQDQPAIIASFPGQTNQEAAFVIVAAFALVLCLYNALYYGVLELFEHEERLPENGPLWLLWLEFAVRCALVALMALKIIKYDAFNSLFMFAGTTGALLLVWLWILRCQGNARFTGIDWVGSLAVMVLGFLAAWLLKSKGPGSIYFFC